MKKNLFDIGAKISDGWTFDNETEIMPEKMVSKNAHQLVFKLEKRNNKPVTLVGRFFITTDEKKIILSTLKKKLSTGGTVNGEWIEIQGDMKEKIKSVLLSLDWKFK